ncbi:hypothetical protein [Streptomyces minutiscleroticus]|uniref:hypothetical protein n=1 Tax=Streptomyces minutiscleroticus TaxID=68238 RepID=UPI001E28264A|nr:hypothetical protein [Streptomyces minutiscleroticus]
MPEERPDEATHRLRPVPAEPAAPDAARPGAGGRGTAPARPVPPARHPQVPRPAAPPPATGPAADAPTAHAPRPAPGVDPVLGTATGRPFFSLGHPDTGDRDTTRPRPGTRAGARAAAAAACLVLGLGLIGGAVTGSWLTGDEAGAAGGREGFAAAGDLWHSVPVDTLFPPTVDGEGAGPGGADRTWTRVAVAPDSGCEGAFDPLLRKALAPAGCLRLLRATYTDATRSHVTTVGLLFTKADPATTAALRKRFEDGGLDRRGDLMPRPYAAKDTVAAGFGDEQRAAWTISVLTDAPVVVYAVSGFADGRTVADPRPAAEAMRADATTAPAQAGLGHEAQGLADRVERGLRRIADPATETPS